MNVADHDDDYFKNVWKPSMILIGQENIPDLQAGNVLRSYSSFRYTMSLCPNLNSEEAKKILTKLLTEEKALYNAKVNLDITEASTGLLHYNSNEILENLNDSSMQIFKKVSLCWASAESNGFLSKLKNYYSNDVEFLITGFKSFDSNSRAEDENLNLEYTKNVLCTLFKFLENYD